MCKNFCPYWAHFLCYHNRSFATGTKTKARNRYIVTIIDGEWCYIKKFTGSQLRATTYRVKLSECYRVPFDVSPRLLNDTANDDHDDTEELCKANVHIPVAADPTVIPAPHLLTKPANDTEVCA